MTLPTKKSELIRLAIKDLERVESMPEVYKVDMDYWHEPQDDGLCYTCLAGAVMAGTMGLEPSIDTCGSPSDALGISDEDSERLDWLDNFRCGCAISNGTAYVSYEEDPEAFKSWALKKADRYEEIGE